MKNLLLIPMIALSFIARSQNLVPNSSFEDTTSCPVFGGQIDHAIGWSSYSHTPDYCNACNTQYLGVPQNQWGSQYPKTGNAYAGLITFFRYTSYREYIGIQLTQSLTVGTEYYVSLFVSPSFNVQTQLFGIATNKIGVRMSTVPYTSINPMLPDDIAQVYTDSVISDTINWTRIAGSFVADSTYNILIIGNFFHDSLTTAVLIDSSATHAYYYIDDIKLSPDSIYVNGITERDLNPIMVIPNPASEWFEIKGNEMQAFELFDVFGRKLISNDKIVLPCIINTSSLSAGTYFLKVLIKNDVINKTILITH